MLTLAVLAGARIAAGQSAAANPVAEMFRQLDVDGDRKLSEAEYLKRPGDAQVHRRDFHLFDFDGDGWLTQAEFAAIPGLVPPHQRGPLPDPFDHLLDQAVAAMDEAYNQWDRRTTATIDTRTFVSSFAASISPDGTARYGSAALAQADLNRDGQVTRDEARRFLEIQLGIRAPNGDSLRAANGRVVNWKRFHWLDADKDGVISRDEYHAKGGANAEKVFASGDRDGDGLLTWDEYRDPVWPTGHEDPIEWFRRADTNLDGLIDAEELLAGTMEYRRPLAAMILPVFDEDNDGRLSLNEYRFCMLGNWICGWESIRTDANRDLQLTFDEFLNEKEEFLLLQRLYFHRFDRDGDGRLSKAEYAFKENPPNTLYRLAVDGAGLQQVFRDPQRPTAGSPEVSPDGKWIAFDLYPEGKILLLPFDGGEPRELCQGLMPSWSSDGRLLTFSWNGGIWIIDADGGKLRQISQGWGAQWSPDGQTIAYTNNGGLWAYDLATERHREVLPRGQHPYLMLYYGMTWSPDSRRIALKGTKQVGSDILSVDMSGGPHDLQVHFTTTESLSHDLAWTPDGQRLVFSVKTPEFRQSVLHQVELTPGAEPTVYPGIDPNLTYMNNSFSRDGRWLVLTAK